MVQYGDFRNTAAVRAVGRHFGVPSKEVEGIIMTLKKEFPRKNNRGAYYFAPERCFALMSKTANIKAAISKAPQYYKGWDQLCANLDDDDYTVKYSSEVKKIC